MTPLIAAAGLAVLVALAAIDVRRRRIPNAIVLPAAAAVLAAQCAATPDRAREWIVASLGTFAFLLGAHVVYPAGLGMGDVKLGLLLGALLGARTPSALLVGLIAMGAAGLVIVALHGLSRRKTALPLAPFLLLGSLVALLL